MNKKQYLYSNLFAWGLVFLLIGIYAFGWTTPTEDPPGGNIVLESGATPVGSTGYIQFNDDGNLGADSNLFWNNTDKRLGIGTTAPKNKLDVEGGGVIGATYSGTNTAPSNGLLVQGNVGIGTTSPGTKLEVAGAIKVGTQDTCNAATAGSIRYVSSEQKFEGCDGDEWKTIWIGPCGNLNEVTFTYKGEQVTYGVVASNDKCWLDRNLGASRVATAYNDSEAYGDLFQWGRLDDGHQTRTSGTTGTLSSSDDPGHSNFITSSNSPYDWRSPQNNNLWQGDGGINDPCPPGWRVPTESEWTTEMNSWGSSDYNGAYASPLKLTAGGRRYNSNASLCYVGSHGFYWSSTVGEASARVLRFGSSFASFYSYFRAYGRSVRCVQD
jgi:uncharacterized protein (TIGR02145 family)